MRLPRFRLRALMIAVAVAAVVLAVYAGIERRRSYLRAVARHHLEMVAANSIVHRDGDQMSYEPGPSLRKCQLARYHFDLWRKYTRVARHPWLSIEPDPPPHEPEPE
jgi:hypothetical protein